MKKSVLISGKYEMIKQMSVSLLNKKYRVTAICQDYDKCQELSELKGLTWVKPKAAHILSVPKMARRRGTPKLCCRNFLIISSHKVFFNLASLAAYRLLPNFRGRGNDG